MKTRFWRIMCFLALTPGFQPCGKYGATGPITADNSALLKGLFFYGGGTQVLVAQAIGSLIVTVSTFAVAYAVMYVVNAMGLLRISAEGENYGLDLHEHGISGYPEYVITSVPRPASMVAHGSGSLTVESPARVANQPAR